jgi:hypothetical protein
LLKALPSDQKYGGNRLRHFVFAFFFYILLSTMDRRQPSTEPAEAKLNDAVLLGRMDAFAFTIDTAVMSNKNVDKS